MDILIQFVLNNWASISAIIAAIGLRLFPTEKNYDIFHKILKLLDLIVPNIKKGGGRHGVAKLLLFFVLASGYAESYAQRNVETRQLRFRSGVQHAIDTAQTPGNEGNIWYDFATGRYRANEGGTNQFLVRTSGGGGTYSSSEGITLSGTDFRLGGAISSGARTLAVSGFGSFAVQNSGVTAFNATSSSIVFGRTANTTLSATAANGHLLIGGTTGLLKYNTDNYATYDDRTVPDWGNVWHAKGLTTISTAGTTVGVAADLTLSTTTTGFQLTDGDAANAFLVTDNRTSPEGIVYGADYSAAFTNRSLADWGNVWKVKGITTVQDGASIVGPNGTINFSNVNDNIGIQATANASYIDIYAGTLASSDYSGLYAHRITGTSVGSGIGGTAAVLAFHQTSSTAGTVVFTDNRITKTGIVYAGDYTPTFTNESVITKRYADTKIDGTMASTNVPYGTDANTLTQEAGFNYTAGSDLLTVGNVTVSSGSSGNISFGTYTPTLTNGANVATSVARQFFYTRVGNIVNVNGTFDATWTTALVTCNMDISLPIASNFADVYDASGALGGNINSIDLNYVQGNQVSDRVTSAWRTNNNGGTLYVQFQYVIK